MRKKGKKSWLVLQSVPPPYSGRRMTGFWGEGELKCSLRSLQDKARQRAGPPRLLTQVFLFFLLCGYHHCPLVFLIPHGFLSDW